MLFLPCYCFWCTGSLDLYMSRVVIVYVLLDLRSVLVSWISCVPLVLWCWVLVFLFAELFFFLLVLCFCFAKGSWSYFCASELECLLRLEIHCLGALFWLILRYLKVSLFHIIIIFLKLIYLYGFPFFVEFAASLENMLVLGSCKW